MRRGAGDGISKASFAEIITCPEELSAGAAIERETQKRLAESRAEIERLQGLIDSMSAAHVTEIDKITGRVLQAEQRYTDLQKRTLVDLDRERTTASKLQKPLDAERKASASRATVCNRTPRSSAAMPPFEAAH